MSFTISILSHLHDNMSSLVSYPHCILLLHCHHFVGHSPPLTYRHKIPPRNLIHLARRYHSEITLRPLMAKSSSIALLQPPPAWALASSIASDRVLRQKWIRDEFGSTSTTTSKLNRHQRKNRLKQLRNSNSVDGNRAVCGGNSSIPDSYSSLLRSSVGAA